MIRAVQGFSKAQYAHSASKKKMKKLSDETLLGIVQRHIEGGTRDLPGLHEATLALCELSIRPLGKTYEKNLDYLAKDLADRTNGCLVDLFYAVEIAGVKKDCFDSEADSSELIHPYPCADIMKQLRREWEKGATGDMAFDEYICSAISQHQREKVRKVAIRYLSEDERTNHEVHFRDRQIFIGQELAKNLNYIFILTVDGQHLYAGRKKKGDFQHTSFFEGEPVLCAGRFTIEDGKIVEVKLNSGHYKPKTNHGDELRTYLAHPSRLGEEANAIDILEFSEE